MWLSFAGIIGLKTSPPALKGPLARDETAVPSPRRVIPDGCNLGVLLRAIGFVFALAACAALGASASANEAIDSLLYAMSFAVPGTLGTLMLWCAARRALSDFGMPLQRAIAWLIPGLVAGALDLDHHVGSAGQARGRLRFPGDSSPPQRQRNVPRASKAGDWIGVDRNPGTDREEKR